MTGFDSAVVDPQRQLRLPKDYSGWHSTTEDASVAMMRVSESRVDARRDRKSASVLLPPHKCGGFHPLLSPVLKEPGDVHHVEGNVGDDPVMTPVDGTERLPCHDR